MPGQTYRHVPHRSTQHRSTGARRTTHATRTGTRRNYYYGGPHLFFGVYYGGRAPCSVATTTSQNATSHRHVPRATEISDDRCALCRVPRASATRPRGVSSTADRSYRSPDDLFPENGLRQPKSPNSGRSIYWERKRSVLMDTSNNPTFRRMPNKSAKAR